VSRAVILTVLLAGLVVIGTSSPAWAAQLDARINPNSDTSPFSMHYLKTVFIEYPNGEISSMNYVERNGPFLELLIYPTLVFRI